MNIKHILFLSAAIFLLPHALRAQADDVSPVVTGVVTDTDGNPMYQVMISDSAGKMLSTTDLFGRFDFKTESDELSFKADGYSDMKLSAGHDMKIVMKPDPTRLDEILDYGNDIRRRRSTASESVSTLSGSQLEDIPTSNFSQMLEGQLLGLGTLERGSDPGAASVDKFVRGISTMHGTSPLIVIDGIAMQDYNLDYLTAAEIDNIVLLKDAAATAIYGMKGANGVLVITTKRGLPGAFDVRVTADFSMQQIGTKPHSLSSGEYASLRNEAWANDGSLGDAPFSQYQLEQINAGNNPLYPNNNYYNEFVKDFATMERVGVSLSGGTQRTRVWSNVNVMNQTSMLKQDTEEYVSAPRRFWVNFRARLDVDISKRVHAFASIAGNVRNDRLASGYAYTNENLYSTIFSLPPTMVGPTNDDGRVTTMETVSNPTYGILNRSGYTKYTGMYASTQAGLKVDLDFITKGLSVTGKLAFQSSNDRYNYSRQDYSRYYYDYTLGNYVQLGSNIDTNLTNSASGMFQYAVSYIAQVDYERSFGKNNVGGHFYSYFTEEQFDEVDSSYPAVGFAHFNHNMGFNFSYDYDSRYVVSATLGISGSDVFPRKNRYNLVPAASAAWVVSNESFLKDSEWLSLLKVRASYGMLALDDFQVGSYRYFYKDYILKNGEVRLQGNPDLKPERHSVQNYGIEFGLWNKLNLTFDYFRRSTNNMLIDSGHRIPSYQGIYVSNCMKVNEGKMKNNGIELGINYSTPLGRGWSIYAGVNYAHTVNRIIYTGEQPYLSTTSGSGGFAYPYRQEGYAVGQQFGYLIDWDNNGGYISDAQQLTRYKEMYREIGTPRLGDFAYRDLNGDGIINQKDMAPIGNGSIPTDFTTFRFGFGWKGIEVDLMVQGVTGYYGHVEYNTETIANGIFNDLHMAAWTAERAASGSEIKSPALSYNTSSVSYLDNDYLIAKRSFWRLKNASISYTLPAKLLRNAGISRLKIVLSGQNLFTSSALASKVINPETGSMTALPSMRVINLGVKLDF